MDNTTNSEQPEARRSLHVEWEIVLSGGHPDICVIISAPESATDAELQSLAETEAMAKTYIWSKKRVRPNDGTQRGRDADAPIASETRSRPSMK